jgi:hypothetical protein
VIVTVALAAIPSVLALVVLCGMIYRGAAAVARQLEATQQNTVAIQALTQRMLRVEAGTARTNVIATDIQTKVTNGTDAAAT